MLRKAMLLLIVCVMLISVVQRADAAGLGCVIVDTGVQLNLDTLQTNNLERFPQNAVDAPGYYFTGSGFTVPVSTPDRKPTQFLIKVYRDLGDIKTVRTVSSQVGTTIHLGWSYDGNAFFYLWIDPHGKTNIGVADHYGNERNTTSFALQPGETLDLETMGLGSRYLPLIKTQRDKTKSLIFLAVPSLAVVYTIKDIPELLTNNCNYIDGCKHWSPQQKTVAYLVDNALWVLTPGTQKKQVFSIDSPVKTLLWSPDGRYLAVLTTPVNSAPGRLHLQVLNIDSGQVQFSADDIYNPETGEGTPLEKLLWTADSQTVLYLPQSPNTGPSDYSLEMNAYRVQQNRSEVLADVADEPVYNSALTRAVIVENNVTGRYIELLDVATGQKNIISSPGMFSNELATVGASWQRQDTLVYIVISDLFDNHNYILWTDEKGAKTKKIDLGTSFIDYGNGTYIGNPFHWENFPDSDPRRFVFTADENNTVFTISLLNLVDGSLKKLASASDHFNVFFAPDNRTVAYTQSSDISGEGASTLFIMSLATGQTQSIALKNPIGALGWSPDGSMLIYQLASYGDYQIVSRSGQPIRTIKPIGDNAYAASYGHSLEWIATCRPASVNP